MVSENVAPLTYKTVFVFSQSRNDRQVSPDSGSEFNTSYIKRFVKAYIFHFLIRRKR
jgi:hypothetical protein